MKAFQYIKIAGVQLLLLTGCTKYTDIKTQGTLVQGKLDNYSLLLNGTNNFNAAPAICDYASDDVQLVDGSKQQKDLAANSYYGYWTNSYTWQPVIYPLDGTYYQDYSWNALYNTITIANIIINEVPDVTDATDAQKKAVIAQGLVHRADAYLSLVNTYAKPYNKATAAADRGLPLVLIGTTTQSLARASVQATYNQILSDLKTAVVSLPATHAFTTLPSKSSGFGVLARCYLYMNEYDSAAKYADSALAYQSGLNDLSTLTSVSTSNYPLFQNDPELLLSKQVAYYGYSIYSPYAMRLSDTLLSVLGPDDQRYNFFTVPASSISPDYTDAGGRFFYRDAPTINNYFGRNMGVSVPEMILIKAEYYARHNDGGTAMTWVNRLRIKRIRAGVYTPLTAANADDALVKVIQERQREFFCRMLRWWDMRRLGSETRFQRTLTRNFNGVTYTLTPNSNRYVFPIAEYYRRFNPEIEQNPQ